MKTLLALFILTLSSVSAPLPPAVPKRPLGVPADAKHFNGRWYKVYLEKKSWHAARDKCKELGGQLVTVPDAATWEFVKTLLGGDIQLWLGATDEVTEGRWVWVDGAPVVWGGWRAGEPNNAGGNENFAATYKGAWADCPDSGVVGTIFRAQGYICEWRNQSR